MQYTHIKDTLTGQKISEGNGVGYAGILVLRVNGAHQCEGQVKDVAIDEMALTPQQHTQNLHRCMSIVIILYVKNIAYPIFCK